MGTKKRDNRTVATMAKRLRKAPHMRRFGGYGWTVILLPLDVFESRFVARMYFGTMHGFEPDDLCELRARRLTQGKKPRTWWVMAIKNDVFESKLSDKGRKAWMKTSGGRAT